MQLGALEGKLRHLEGNVFHLRECMYPFLFFFGLGVGFHFG